MPTQRTYTVTNPQGQRISFTGPEGMSRADVITRAKQELAFDSGKIPTEATAGQRAATGFLNTVPNPVDLLHAMFHPVDTARAYALNRMQYPYASAIDDAFPLVPGASMAAHAGGEMAKGNVAGGLGGLAGILLPEVAPEIPGAVLSGTRLAGRGVSATGRALEAAGTATKKASPLIAMTDAIVSRSPMQGAAIAAAPYVAEGGGRVLQKFGRPMEGLGVDTPEISAEVQRFLPNRSRVSREVPGSSYREIPTPAFVSPTATPVTSEGLKELPLYQHTEYMPTETATSAPAPMSSRTELDRVLEGLRERQTFKPTPTTEDDPLASFASGPRIERSSLGSTPTPE